jgi:hypothetical protein
MLVSACQDTRRNIPEDSNTRFQYVNSVSGLQDVMNVSLSKPDADAFESVFCTRQKDEWARVNWSKIHGIVKQISEVSILM